ncbi:MAG TPA: trypsin-like peptidase domain-containing protein [Chitinivibrionales bacterium]|nr:trypsin-like peptidase domain-containing protein [Chitinivibrionales bacterium]
MQKRILSSSAGKTGLYILFLVLGLIVGGIAGAEIFKRYNKAGESQTALLQKADTASAAALEASHGANIPAVEGTRSNAIVRATKMISPCVVGITVTQLQVVRRSYSSDEFFDFFFAPELVPRVKEVERMGSGFLFSRDGFILTNYHVVEGAQKLFVTFSDGHQAEGRVVGVDPQTDLAVVAAKGDNFPFAKLGSSDNLMIGEWAIAIGNPFGFFINDARPTVTVGVISAVDRNFAPSEGVYYQGMIQTDAAINQGNSGGPLVDALGEVIGINTFIFTGSDSYRGSIGIGFAIPIDRAKRVSKELIAYGKRRMIYTGISVQDLNRSLALALGYDRTTGVVISEITKKSPGETAKLTRGDIIVQMGGREIRSSADIGGFFLDYFVGDTVGISYVRKGKTYNTTIVLGEYKGH